MFQPEIMGEQFVRPVACVAPVRLSAQHLHFRSELYEDLTAGAAWGAEIITAGGDDRDTHEVPVPVRYGGGYSIALGADGAAEGGVFHIAAGVDLAVAAFESRADLKARVGHICRLHGIVRQCEKFSVCDAKYLPEFIRSHGTKLFYHTGRSFQELKS